MARRCRKLALTFEQHANQKGGRHAEILGSIRKRSGWTCAIDSIGLAQSGAHDGSRGGVAAHEFRRPMPSRLATQFRS